MKIDYKIDKISLCKKCRLTSIDELSNKLKSFIEETCKLIELDTNHIYCIRIVCNNTKHLGRIRIINYSSLKYTICFNEDVIINFFNDALNHHLKSKSVIMHELYHCKDIVIVGNKIDLTLIEHDSYNYEELFLNLGYHQWSEYNSHYLSSKIYPCSIRAINKYPDNLEEILYNFDYKELFNENDFTWIRLYEPIIHNFIKDMIKLIANYNSSFNEEINLLYNNYCLNPFIKQYLTRISEMLETYRKQYPNWISIISFSNIGKNLLTFK